MMYHHPAWRFFVFVAALSKPVVSSPKKNDKWEEPARKKRGVFPLFSFPSNLDL